MTPSRGKCCRTGRVFAVVLGVMLLGVSSMVGIGPLRAQSAAQAVMVAVEADCDALSRRAAGIGADVGLPSRVAVVRDRCVERSTAALSMQATDPVVDRVLSMQCRAVQAVLGAAAQAAWEASACLREAAGARLKALDVAWVREIQARARAVLCREVLGSSAEQGRLLACIAALGERGR